MMLGTNGTPKYIGCICAGSAIFCPSELIAIDHTEPEEGILVVCSVHDTPASLLTYTRGGADWVDATSIFPSELHAIERQFAFGNV
jgi:hypothetical protein